MWNKSGFFILHISYFSHRSLFFLNVNRACYQVSTISISFHEDSLALKSGVTHSGCSQMQLCLNLDLLLNKNKELKD